MPKNMFKWFMADQLHRNYQQSYKDAARRRSSYRPTTKQSITDFKIGFGALVILIVVCKIFGII